MRILVRRLAACVFLTAVPAACAHAPSSRPALTSPIAFPLYRNSTVLSVRPWHHTLTQAERAVLGITKGAVHAYGGYEVLTATDDSFDDLTAWLQGLSNLPPDGYRVAIWGSGVDEARLNARNMGVDFNVFTRKERGIRHDVLVVAVDPAIVQRRAGVILPLLRRFKEMPAFLRSTVDAQAKAQTGFTVSEVVDPATPIGIAFEALERFHDARARGVILVDTEPEVKR